MSPPAFLTRLRYRSALFIALVYLGFGLLWITGSDGLVVWLAGDTALAHWLQLLKGYFYVTVTALLLYVAVAHLQRYMDNATRLVAEAERAYRAMYEGNPNPMLVYDGDDLRVLSLNTAALQQLGVDAGSALAHTLPEILQPSLSREMCSRLTHSDEEGLCRLGPLRYRRADGRELLLQLVSHPVPFEGHRARLATLLDQTEQLALQQALDTARGRLLEAQRQAGFASWALHRDSAQFVPVEWAPRAQAPFDAGIDALLQQVRSDDRAAVAAAFQRGLDGEAVNLEFWTDDAHGGRCLMVRGEPAVTPEGRYLVGTAVDHTEQRRAERQLADSERHNGELLRSRDPIDQRRLQRETAVANERLQWLSRQLLESTESERSKLAHELHDDIGQLLTVVRLNAGWLEKQAPTAGKEQVAVLTAATAEAQEKLRNLVQTLRPPQLDALGVAAAIEAQLQQSGASARLDCTLTVAPELPRFEPLLEITLFRIFEEALNNILRHANAERIDVRLQLGDGAAQPRTVELHLLDDGGGFDFAAELAAARGQGLGAMLERARLVGGELRISSLPGVGTALVVTLPLQQQENDKDKEEQKGHG